MIYQFKEYIPVIHESSFIHPQAAIIEDGCNVQENCTIHMFPGVTVLLKERAHIGHGAIIHGAMIGKNCLVGMNAVIMDNVELGDESIVGALTIIKEEVIIPARSLIVGNPGKIIKQVSDEMLAWKTEGTRLYQQLPVDCINTLKICEPLREIPAEMAKQQANYLSWKQAK
jgi:phenylacetic acid degradation protein